MEQHSTRRFFNSEFVIKNKLSFSTVILLQDIYFWLLGTNPPKNIKVKGITYYYISQTHFYNLNYGLLTQPRINAIFKELKKVGIISSSFILEYHKNYVSFNWQKIKESMLDKEELESMENNDWWRRIHDYADQQIEQEKNYVPTIYDLEYEFVEKNGRTYLIKKKQSDSYNKNEEKQVSGLLNEQDMNAGKKRGYSKQADAIAKRILKKYARYFNTKYPAENQEPTKTYIRLCQKIDDIYNGRFTSSRFYVFDENVFNNKQFETEGWREKINSVKNDWNKVKQLIFSAIDNFVLMYSEDRMPMKKDYLTTNLNDWFFSDNPNCKGQSQFIQSLNEPMFTRQKLGLNKARIIVKDLKEKSPVSYYAGHELNELLPINANEATSWEHITEIIKWGKLLYQFDSNAKYFLQCEINGSLESGPKVLPALFARYLKDKNISVSLGTMDIERSIDNNAPWCWFINDACNKHGMNSDCLHCFNEQDFYDAYNHTFNDEIVF